MPLPSPLHHAEHQLIHHSERKEVACVPQKSLMNVTRLNPGTICFDKENNNIYIFEVHSDVLRAGRQSTARRASLECLGSLAPRSEIRDPRPQL